MNLPFSKVRRIGDTVYLSGELPLGPDNAIPEGITAQTNLTLDRIEQTLANEALSLSDVVSCTIYLRDVADFAEFNAAYGSRFAAPLPVRTTVRADLMLDALVEITVIAKARVS